MKKTKQYLLWAALFFAISCTNLSKLCKHGFSYSNNEFGSKALKNAATGNIPVSGNEMQAGIVSSYLEANTQSTELNWKLLQDVTFITKYNQQYKMDFKYPKFGNHIKKFEGLEVHIKGYLIPLDVSQGFYAVSKNPYAACFFCGKSGPESVVSLKFKKPPGKIKLDAFKTMKGTLKLNDKDVNDFIYIFTESEEYVAP